MLGTHRLLCLVDEEFHAIEFQQKIVRELDIRLVDLINQQYHLLLGFEGFPQLALDDVVADVLDLLVTELGIPQAGDRIVFVQSLLSLGGGFDVPGNQAQAEGRSHFFGQEGFTSAGLAFDQ